MIQHQHTLTLSTKKRGFTRIDTHISSWLHAHNVHTGLLTVFIQHTSASLLITENADPAVRRDLERFFSTLIIDGHPRFEHADEGPDDMPSHIRSVLTATSLSIPVVKGRLALGTWQGLYLWEHRFSSHQRQVLLHLIGDVA